MTGPTDPPTCERCDCRQVQIDGEYHGLCFDHLRESERIEEVLYRD